ncbi:uncharacterized protein LOC114746526 [Neltuma alba]|nr:uncharacterized protein LOC114746526 [Prosopis alba]
MEKKRGGTEKKREEMSGLEVAHKRSSGEWPERDTAAAAPGFASMNLPHDAATSMEDAAKYISGQGTEAWDMRMAGMGSERGSQSIYWDEEELFNMPALMNSMAEGLIIPPPALQTGFNWLPPEAPFPFTL